MKKLTSLVLAGIFTIFCLTGCSDAEGSTVISEATTTVTTVTTMTTVPESVPESTTTTKETVTSSKETETTTSDISTETTTTVDNVETTTKETTTKPVKKSTTTTTKSTTKETTKVPEPKGNRVVLDVKNIQMLPELPSGSEITCAAMVLNYLGFNVNKMDLINYLTIDEAPDSNHVWGNPSNVFVGHPTKSGYGCYAKVLDKCVKKYFEANNITGYKTDRTIGDTNSFINEIKAGNPIMISGTKGYQEPGVGDSWRLEDGEVFFWTTGYQFYVIIGYDLDKKTFILSDPADPKGTVEYPMDIVERMNMQISGGTLIIRKKS